MATVTTTNCDTAEKQLGGVSRERTNASLASGPLLGEGISGMAGAEHTAGPLLKDGAWSPVPLSGPDTESNFSTKAFLDWVAV